MAGLGGLVDFQAQLWKLDLPIGRSKQQRTVKSETGGCENYLNEDFNESKQTYSSAT